MERVEGRAAVGVEADVLEAHDAATLAVVGDRILREVERAAVGGADDLVHAGALDLVGLEADLERADLRVRALPERPDEPLDVSWCDERLVALDVHVDVGAA